MSRFGFSTEPSSGEDFLPIIKYDARSGRMFRIDRTSTGDSFVNEPVDITDNFKAIFDLENVETGWINFSSGGAPDFKLVSMGQILPGKPSDQHKNGIRFLVKLAKECGGNKPIREIAGTSKAFLGAVEKLFDVYEAQKAANPDKLPVVAMKGSKPVKTGTGERQSTNYVPNFELVGWAPRGDLVPKPRGGNGATNGATNPAASSQEGVPPSTGARIVNAPAAKTEEPAFADDFG